MKKDSIFEWRSARLYPGDFLEVYRQWPEPTVIVVDGPYGVGSFPGDPKTPRHLAQWYEPYIAAWSFRSLPETTLWFWNTEIGWATVHHALEANGWEYRNCHIWDKGLGHIAGNANSKTLRKFPVVTEVCVQYVRKVFIPWQGQNFPLKDWVRHEWNRTGLAFSRANQACGVKNAATRKYLTKDHLWYFPPPEIFVKLVEYANRHGSPSGRPYFSFNGNKPVTQKEWSRMRAKFHCPVGVSNVWNEPQVRGNERLKDKLKCIHMNQKPLRLLELILQASSDPGDVVWEPFGGLCSTAVAAIRTNRQCYSAEILEKFFRAACQRLHNIHPLELVKEPLLSRKDRKEMIPELPFAKRRNGRVHAK